MNIIQLLAIRYTVAAMYHLRDMQHARASGCSELEILRETAFGRGARIALVTTLQAALKTAPEHRAQVAASIRDAIAYMSKP